MRKVEPLSKALRGYAAWVTGIRRVEAPTRANAPLISFDKAFGLVKINPIAAWTDDDMQAYIDANDVLVNPLVHEGYPSIGCAPVHREAGRGRRSAQRSLGGSVEDGMRAARVVSPSRCCPPTLVLTAHGSADPRAAATTHAVAEQIRGCGRGSTSGPRSASRPRRTCATCWPSTDRGRRRDAAAVGRRLSRARRHPGDDRRSRRAVRGRPTCSARMPGCCTVMQATPGRGGRVAPRSEARRDRGGGRLVERCGECPHRDVAPRSGGRNAMGGCDHRVRDRTAAIAGGRRATAAPPRRRPAWSIAPWFLAHGGSPTGSQTSPAPMALR